jgi:hypothetical protein
LRAEWALLKNRFRIEERAWDPEASLLEPDIAVYKASLALPDADGLKRRLMSNADLLATLLELRAAKYMLSHRFARASEVHASIVGFYEYLPDDRKQAHSALLKRLGPLVDVPFAERVKYWEKLERVYGRELAVATRFGGLEFVAKDGGAPVLIAEHPETVFTVGDGQPGENPLLLPAGLDSVPLSVSVGGAPSRLELTIPAGRRILFLEAAALPGKVGEAPTERKSAGAAGLKAADPIRLPNRTIKLKGKDSDWDGIEPIIEGHFTGGAFFANPDYAITRVYMCRDKKYLYWRIDFAKTNPFYRPPIGIGKKYLARLCFQYDLENDNYEDICIFLQRRLEAPALDSFMGVWNRNTGKWSDKGKDMIYFTNTSTFLEQRIPLSRITKYVKKTVLLYINVANCPKDDSWESWAIKTPIRYIDF